MKALLLSQYRQLQITDIPMPALGDDELLVRVAACGICGSDVHGFDGSSGRRIPPIVMGHEAAGIVADVGKNVSGFKSGDRVTFDSTVYCGDCPNCRRGNMNLCDRRQVLGVSCGDYRRNGAFAEFVVVPGRIAYHLPENLSFNEAALLEAVSVALHAVALAPKPADGAALVVGAGTIGLLVQQSLAACGYSRIFVTDVDENRLKLSKSLGATAILNSGPGLLPEVMRLTSGVGADVVIEAVGNNQAVSTAINCTRKGGTVVLVGNVSPEVTIPLQVVVSRQIRLQGSCASCGEYPRAIELMSAGKINVKPLISAVAPLDEGPQWFDRLYAREPNLMKVVLAPGKTA
ncbi:MAG TPA: galactitol-1-phosphate 5-dehydrogenase [Terriglobales bacterium]|nr:galactitol-1-phosphate 5-dehydrogenase [Terriglobales bacterium]